MKCLLRYTQWECKTCRQQPQDDGQCLTWLSSAQERLYKSNVALLTENVDLRQKLAAAPAHGDFDPLEGIHEVNKKLRGQINELLPIADAYQHMETRALRAEAAQEAAVEGRDTAEREALAALYGARECLGKVGNIQHAIDLLEAALRKKGDDDNKRREVRKVR